MGNLFIGSQFDTFLRVFYKRSLKVNRGRKIADFVKNNLLFSKEIYWHFLKTTDNIQNKTVMKRLLGQSLLYVTPVYRFLIILRSTVY